MSGVVGMDERELLAEHAAHHRAQRLYLARLEALEAGEALLGIDDRVEVAAVGDIDLQPADARHVSLEPARMQVGRHVGEPHPLDERAVLPVLGNDEAGRRVEVELARRARLDQPALERHGDRADGAVAAHRQAARGLDEQDRDVAVVPRRRHRGSSPTSCRGRAARTSGSCGSSRTRRGNGPAARSWSAPAAPARRRRRCAPDCRRCAHRCRRTYASPSSLGASSNSILEPVRGIFMKLHEKPPDWLLGNG